MTPNSRVALCRGTERVSTLQQCLTLVMDDIDWSTRRDVVIKPNLVHPGRPLSLTHRNALATVLEAVRARYAGRLTIAEGSAEGNTMEAYAALGFRDLARFYGAELVDINADDGVPVTAYNAHAAPMVLHLSRRAVESDCRISLCLPKTHDTVVVTASIKNMVMGALIKGTLAVQPRRGAANDKGAMHQGYPIINVNLALLAPLVWPHLTVLDGFVGMEGDGPCDGTAVDWRIALASTDALAADALTAHLMGYPLHEIGYLTYCQHMGLGVGDWQAAEIVGNAAPAQVARRFKPHCEYQEQLEWAHPEADRLLQRDPREGPRI